MNINVFKFGGASVKDASAVQNLGKILENFKGSKLVVVVSAMGKTTNALENVLNAFYEKRNFNSELEIIRNYHREIIDGLFTSSKKKDIISDLNSFLEEIRSICKQSTRLNYNSDYDKIVSIGELISTRIIYNYLLNSNFSIYWEDVRKLIKTNDLNREAAVIWEDTEQRIISKSKEVFADYDILITQGFIGSDENGNTTTLGREGSDFTGAIFAWAINAQGLTIWKDVPGLLNADPKIFDNTIKIDCISYGETVELAYYGATIIHPKTIKPLQNKQIPLYVKSFIEPKEDGSRIQSDSSGDRMTPSFILKKNQLLISLTPRDYSFMNEEHLARIFSYLAKLHIKVNMMQNSAISFSICVDDNPQKTNVFIKEMSEEYKIKYNKNLDLFTIRHYSQKEIEKVIFNRNIILEQRNRTTIQLVMT